MALRLSALSLIVILFFCNAFFEIISHSEAFLAENGTQQTSCPSSRIIGGKKAKSLVPYIVSIREKDDVDKVIGGGSIVKSNWILTARHLLIKRDPEGHIIGLRNLTVAPNYGNKLSIAKDKKKYQVQKMFCYNPGTQDYKITDVALLKLGENIPLDNSTGFYFDKIPIIKSPSEVSWSDGMDIVGWGQTRATPEPKPKDFPDNLMEAHVYKNSLPDCCREFPYFVEPEMMCIGKKSQTAGTGDSGGPVVMKKVTTKELVQVAIISGGRADCKASTIGMDLNFFRDWVEQRIADEDPKSECKNVFQYHDFVLTENFR